MSMGMRAGGWPSKRTTPEMAPAVAGLTGGAGCAATDEAAGAEAVGVGAYLQPVRMSAQRRTAEVRGITMLLWMLRWI
jgi:hypothetical protein